MILVELSYFKVCFFQISFYGIFDKCNHVFGDDFEAHHDLMYHYNTEYEKHKNVRVISEGLFPLVRYCNVYHTSVGDI